MQIKQMMLAYDEIYPLLASHAYNLSEHLKIPEACVDLLFFDLEEADLSVLTRAVNQGILLINHDPEYLSNMIDKISRYLLENETMIIRAQRLRQERMEAFGET